MQEIPRYFPLVGEEEKQVYNQGLKCYKQSPEFKAQRSKSGRKSQLFHPPTGDCADSSIFDHANDNAIHLHNCLRLHMGLNFHYLIRHNHRLPRRTRSIALDGPPTRSVRLLHHFRGASDILEIHRFSLPGTLLS